MPDAPIEKGVAATDAATPFFVTLFRDPRVTAA